MQHDAAAKIFRTAELDRRPGRGIALQQIDDALFARGIIFARWGMIECQDTHKFTVRCSFWFPVSGLWFIFYVSIAVLFVVSLTRNLKPGTRNYFFSGRGKP